MWGRAGGVPRVTLSRYAFMRDQMTWHLDDYCWSVEVRGSYQETAPRKTSDNTVKHHNGGVGSVVANHRDGSESLVVVRTLNICNALTV